MATNFLKHALTDSVRKAQEHYYGSSPRIASTPGRDALTEDEIALVQACDSFYMATVNESGWPYIQHRGGCAGFLRVLNPAEETARQKVQAAEDARNSRDPERVAPRLSSSSGEKWNKELDYRLKKELWAFRDNRIAVRFEYV